MAAAPKILVVEDELIVAKDLCAMLERFGYEVSGRAASGARALELAAELRPDLVLMDIHLRGQMDGIATAQELHRRQQLPVLFITAFADDDTIARASATHALGYVIKPFQEQELKSVLALAVEKSRSDRVLQERQDWLTRTLASFGQGVVRSEPGSELHAAIKSELLQLHSALQEMADGVARFDADGRCIFANRAYAQMHGYEAAELVGLHWSALVAADARASGDAARSELKHERKLEAEVQGLRRDGSTFFKAVTLVPLFGAQGQPIGQYTFARDISDRVRAEEVLRTTILELEASRARLEELAIRDELTQLFNRREFNRLLREEWERSLRHTRPLSLLLIDIDHFKRVNDRFGHDVGDRVLVELSRRVRDGARKLDRVARFGGEELAVICPETPIEGAAQFAERTRRTIAERPLTVTQADGDTIELTVTASIGLAERSDDHRDEAGLVRAADLALYAAKRQGRNRAVRYAPAMHQSEH